MKKGLDISQTLKIPQKKSKFFNDAEQVPSRDKKYSMTIVWDIDETLLNLKCKGNESGHFDGAPELRTGIVDVLIDLKKPDVEYIIWTAGGELHAHRCVSSIQEVEFDYIIHKKHNSDPGYRAKELSLLKRDMSSILIIDDNPKTAEFNEDNVILIPSFSPLTKGQCLKTTEDLHEILRKSMEYKRNCGGVLSKYCRMHDKSCVVWFRGKLYTSIPE